MKNLSLEYRVKRLEKLLMKTENSHMFENVQLSSFECDKLAEAVTKELKRFSCSIEVADDNADNGFVNIGIYNRDDEYVTDYDIEFKEYNSCEVTCNDKHVGNANSFESAAKIIANHFIKNNKNSI